MSTYERVNSETTDEEVELINKLQEKYPKDYDEIARSFGSSPKYMENILIKQAHYRFD